jgi:lysyl-tRNA synthetase class 2
MNLLAKSIWEKRSKFLKSLRAFFDSQDFLELDTPAFKKIVGMEPYLDPFLVRSPSGLEKGYLITSPEYSMKMAGSVGLERFYEIAHVFRSGEKGSPVHTPEFLMLEFYMARTDLGGLMDFCEDLFATLNKTYFDFRYSEIPKRRVTNQELFVKFTGRGWEREDLLRTLRNSEIPFSEEDRYEDLYFSVFLNWIEPHLAKEKSILFLYEYPPECAALAKIRDGVAQRFEIYWDGLELANAFEELLDPREQEARFLEEQSLRAHLGKEVFPIDRDFLDSLSGLPPMSGISIGLDRLLMKILGLPNLRSLSPYFSA